MTANELQRNYVRAIRIAVLILGVLLATAIVLYFVYRPDPRDPIPVMAFVLVAAASGSLINESSRWSARHPSSQPGHEPAYICWKMLVAFVFANFLYLLFMSGILTGPLFPQFQEMRPLAGTGPNYTNMLDFMVKCKPENNEDTAKALVWSFIAGYAERFVPNLINRLRDTAETGASDPVQQRDEKQDGSSAR